jgi:hypothetical protein
MLQALETSLFAKEGIPTSKDQQPVKKMQDCHPSIAPSENRETCPNNPKPLSTQVGRPVGRERESLWPGKPPGTENSQNINRIQPSFGKQTQTLDENQNEKLLIRSQDKQQSKQSPAKEDLMIPRRACNHPEHQAKTYVGQPISIRQDMTSSGTIQSHTQMGGRKEEMEDNTHTRINSQRSMGEWFPTSEKLTIDQVHPQTCRKVLWNPQQSTDYLGNHNFQQDQEGIVIRTSSGQPLCNYCPIPSHAREKCVLRLATPEQGCGPPISSTEGYAKVEK